MSDKDIRRALMVARATGGRTQAITSADTSIKQVPALFKSPVFETRPGQRNLDIGGGKYDLGTEHLAREHGVESHVYDPFNRSAEHNDAVLKKFARKKADSVTAANVLNVIQHPHHRKAVIQQAHDNLHDNGAAYFGIYEGNGTGVGGVTSKGWQNNRKAAGYMDEVRSVFPHVERKGNIIVARKRSPRATGGPVPPFKLHSGAADLIEKKGQPKATPQQYAAMPGIKPDEIKHSNFAALGTKAIPREQAAQHLRENAVPVQETVLGARNKDDYIAKNRDWLEDNFLSLHGRLPRSHDELAHEVDAGNDTEYSEYQLPGGKNYREVLLHTPVKAHAPSLELEKARKRADEAARAYDDALLDQLSGSPRLSDNDFRRASSEFDAARIAFNRLEQADKRAAQNSGFYSSHWDVPNVLAHIRMSDREGPNDEKVLHVEELQSDWGQQGREKGFNPKKTTPPRLTVSRLSNGNWEVYNESHGRTAVDEDGNEAIFPTEREARAMREQLLRDPYEFASGVPFGPYVDTTPKWTDLALKRVLHEAAHGGYDKVVFTPGGEQNKRYPGADSDHRKYYDEIMPKRLQALAQQHDPQARVQLHAHPIKTPLTTQEKAWQGMSNEPYTDVPQITPLHALDVTPQMRDSIKAKGFNQFKKGGAVEAEHPAWIPTRLITSKKHVSRLKDRNIVGLEAMKQTPDVFQHNVDLVRAYPNLPRKIASLKSHDRVAEAFIEHAKNNLLALHDAVPEHIRQRSKLWYDGARAITDRWSKKYGLPDHSIAGVLAALSPQKDWYQNVSLAERVLDAMSGSGGNFYNGYPFDAKMARTFASRKSLNKPAYEGVRNLLTGRTLADLDALNLSPEAKAQAKALWIRMHDEAHNDPAHLIVTPEGGFADNVTTAKGGKAKVGWGSLTEIGKAIMAIENAHNPAALSELMGEKHKVRNFYNNILAPNSPHGDVTIDTHAVAAGLLRPLSGKSIEVAHNFANYPGKDLPTARGTALTGIQGTYPLYAEAYRRAAAERGVLPREMQSITWEAVRGLFPDTMKTPSHNARVNGIWNLHRSGRIDQNEAQRRIFDASAPNGIPAPTWFVEGTSGADESNRGAAGSGALPELAVRGPSSGTSFGRARGGTAPTVPPEPKRSSTPRIVDEALRLLGGGFNQFKRGGEVDDDKLIALHNTNEHKLEMIRKLGGLPVPSVAVVKPKHGFTRFGDISLVGGSEFATPSKENPVFASDVYSPRFPSLSDDESKIFRGFTPMGNRRYAPLTIENVVREMKGKVRGGEGGSYGAGSIRAMVTPKFKTLESLKKSHGRLVPSEEFKPLREAANKKLFDLANKFQPYGKWKDIANYFDRHLAEVAQFGPRAFSDYYENVPPELTNKAMTFLHKLKNMPTEYFEAKPQRAVKLGEFSGAIVPKDVPLDVPKYLESRGIPNIATYDPSDPESRKEALAQFKNITFKKGGMVDHALKLTARKR